jgi:hypothetical protein
MIGDNMTDKLIDALVKAQQEINHVVQDASNPFFKSDFACLKQVFDTVKKPYNDNGIYIQQIAHESEAGVAVETVFYGHGGKISTGVVPIPAAKHDPQAYGSALSYAKRYSLLMACGIATKKEDDDAEAAMRHAPARQGKYKIVAEDGETVLEHADKALDYLAMCRKHMGNPEEHGGMYQANKWFVKAAFKDARGKTKDDIGKMIALYEGEAEQEVQDEETNS